MKPVHLKRTNIFFIEAVINVRKALGRVLGADILGNTFKELIRELNK